LSATTGDVSFVLKGILIDADERTALFRSKRSDKLVRLGEGDKIEGWTLVRIEADQVILASGEIEKALELTFDPPTPTKRTRREKSSQNNKQQQGQEQVDQSNPAQVSTPE
jgi:type II secretory pathway component PulC